MNTTIKKCYHSNQSSFLTKTKNTIYVEDNVRSMYEKFQLHPPYVSSKFCFKFVLKFTLQFCRHGNQKKKISNLAKSHMKRRGLLNKHLCELFSSIAWSTGANRLLQISSGVVRSQGSRNTLYLLKSRICSS